MTGRKQVKALIGALAASPPLRPLVQRVLRPRANIVYYHFVGKTAPHYKEFSGHRSLQQFEQDLVLLKSCFDLVPLQEILTLHRDGRIPDSPRLAVTFDDGFDLVRGGAMEVLDRHGVKATVFLITSCIDNRSLMWRNKISLMINSLPEATLLEAYNGTAGLSVGGPATGKHDILSQSMLWPMRDKEERVNALWAATGMAPVEEYLAEHRPYMTWDDLETWRAHGHGVGLHTHTHPICAALDDDLVAEEIEQPAAFLKQRFDLETLPFSYPFGVRLPEATENRLLDDGVLQCALGIHGSVPLDPAHRRLERTGIEKEMTFQLFGKGLIGAARNR